MKKINKNECLKAIAEIKLMILSKVDENNEFTINEEEKAKLRLEVQPKVKAILESYREELAMIPAKTFAEFASMAMWARI